MKSFILKNWKFLIGANFYLHVVFFSLVLVTQMLFKRTCLDHPEMYGNATRQYCIAWATNQYLFYHADFTVNGKQYAWNDEIEMYEEKLK